MFQILHEVGSLGGFVCFRIYPKIDVIFPDSSGVYTQHPVCIMAQVLPWDGAITVNAILFYKAAFLIEGISVFIRVQL